VYNRCTGLVDWTGGLIQIVQNRSYSAYNFAELAPSVFSPLSRVSRGQRSIAYLMSFDENIRRSAILSRNQTPAFAESRKKNILISSNGYSWSLL